jgi:hypothetical protein
MATKAAFSGIDQRQPAISAALVADYKKAHEDMLAAIAAMDDLAQGAAPNQLRLSHTRLRIIRASSESRSIYKRIVAILLQQPIPDILQRVEPVVRLHFHLREVANRHLNSWTHEQSLIDWEGYCRSSEEIRQLWREAIECERKLLYPLL